MSTNANITYWNSVKNTYSDALPNPDVVTGAIFNDLNSAILEYKWRKSVARSVNYAQCFTNYGQTVPSGSVLMHQCAYISFKDVTTTTENHRRVVKFHILQDMDEQVVTYYSSYDTVNGIDYQKIDYGSDKFPVTVKTSMQGGARNALYFEVRAVSNTNKSFSYWVETDVPVITTFDVGNFVRTSSNTSAWDNLDKVIAGTLGSKKSGIYNEYVYYYGYQTVAKRLGETDWSLNSSGSHTAHIYSGTNGSTLEIDYVNADKIDGYHIGAYSVTAYGMSATQGSFTYLSCVSLSPTGGSLTLYGDQKISGDLYVDDIYTYTGGSTVLNIHAGITVNSINSGSLIATSSIVMGSSSVLGNLTASSFTTNTADVVDVLADKVRLTALTTYNGNNAPTSMPASGRINSYGNLDLRNTANTAGQMYFISGRGTTNTNSSIYVYLKVYYYGNVTQEITKTVFGSNGLILIGTGITGVFYPFGN